MLTSRLIKCATAWMAVVARSSFATAFTGGFLVGLMVVSVWLSWMLTWGEDGALSFAAAVMLAAGLVFGERQRLYRLFGWTELSIAGCTWTLLQPWFRSVLAAIMKLLPAEMLVDPFQRFLFGLVCATPVWFALGVFGASVVGALCGPIGGRPRKSSANAIGLTFGIAFGLVAEMFVLGPWFGIATVLGAVTLCMMILKLVPAHWMPGLKAEIDTVDDLEAAPFSKTSSHANWKVLEALRVMAVLVTGSLLAIVVRLAGQLVLNASQFIGAEWIGLVIGFGLGLLVIELRLRWSPLQNGSLGPSAVLIPAASATLLLATFPLLIQASLSATASLTTVFMLMTFRVILMTIATVPIGFALAHLAVLNRTDSNCEKNRRFPVGGLSFALIAGYEMVSSNCGTVAFVVLLCGCCLMAIGLAAVSLFVFSETRPTRMEQIGWAVCGLLSLSAPMWSGHDDPARVAKLLFSTPSFVAHRAGWESNLLSTLDDTHVVAQAEGAHGTWTLWRSRGIDLQLKENGIPRDKISSNTDVQPQFAPSVLQAVFPLSIVDQPRRVMVLGAGAGTSLETCLQFPVQEVVCVENDLKLIDLLRGPIARETGHDPLADDRTRLVTVPPTIALMTGNDRFDVILSSPPSSAVIGGAASYTVEYYRNASHHLAVGGVFSQRFDCIDYGPKPLQLVVQSMRSAFREVVAVETAVGEMLLLASNTEGVFVPSDLAARLGMSHVRHVLARSGLDWSVLLNYPAYDAKALAEICAEGRAVANSSSNGLLAMRAPTELMRWGPKLLEVQQVLTAKRSSVSPYANLKRAEDRETEVANLSRKSRMLEWLGDEHVSPEVLRRLAEVAAQRKLAYENPEAEMHWWEYRKAIKQQLLDRPLNRIKKVAHIEGEVPLDPQDERRKEYCVTLGKALAKPGETEIAAVESYLQPYDPLISFFARHEIAELHARAHLDSVVELKHRLHVIYFAPPTDASTRIVASTMELIVREPQAVPDTARRFDLLNGLIQTLRVRWEGRQSHAVKSSRMQLSDVDRCVVATEKAMSMMDTIHGEAGVSDDDWQNRKQVVDRILLRPLRAYRSHLQSAASSNEAKLRMHAEPSPTN